MSKMRIEESLPSDNPKALSYRSAIMDRYHYKNYGRHIYPKTITRSNKTGKATSVRFGGGQDKKVLVYEEGKRIFNPRSGYHKTSGSYKYKADPAYKGESRHKVDLRKVIKDKSKE